MVHSEFTPLQGVKMKVVLSSSKPSKAPVVPPIPLIKEEEKAYAKGSYNTLKLHSNPAEGNSPIYNIQVPNFKSGTCEQFLEFMDKVQAVIVGHNLTTGPQKVAFLRTVLKGDAYTYFFQYFVTVGNEDDVIFMVGVQALTSHIFPQRALRMQKCYMHHYMRKSRDMKMHVYRNRVVELNNYLE